MEFSELNDDTEEINLSQISTPSIITTDASTNIIGNNHKNILTISSSQQSNIICIKDLPNCWTLNSAKHFRKKYSWMTMKDGKLGCSVCSEIKDGKISHNENWIQCMVVANGNTKLTQQSSLRKKLFEHSKTARHIQMVRIIEGEPQSSSLLESSAINRTTVDEDASTTEENMSTEEIIITARIFLVVYNLCLQNRPMVDVEGQIQMLKAMNINMGNCLHSRFTAIRILDHVGSQMKKKLFQYVTSQDATITLIVEEVLSKILQKPTFVLLFQCNLPKYSKPLLLFLDLIELQSSTSQELQNAILASLSKNGFNSEYTWRNEIHPVYTLSTRTRDKYSEILHTLPSDHDHDQSATFMQPAISVSLLEAERLINLLTSILTEERNRLNTEHIANLMMIKAIGKPITEWDPIPYVRTWVKHHRNAMDTRIKNHVEKPLAEYSKELWALID